jgi:hypothetical protein
MPLEQVPELEVFAEHVKTLVPAEAFEVGWVHAFHAGGERAAFKAVPAKIPCPEPRRCRAGLTISAIARDVIGIVPIQGRGGDASGLAGRAVVMRRNAGSSLIAAVSS